MQRARCTTALLAAAALCATGCASIEKRFGNPLPFDEFESVETGSHYSLLLETFGPPTRMTALPAGMAFLYEYVRIRERQYGLTLPGELGKLIKAVYASADARIASMVFVFDDEGALLGSDSEVIRTDAGGGFSVSLIFSLGSLTDTADYEESASQLVDWGAGLTRPPLTTLNRSQSLETGESGFELSGTSPATGQHTLELRPR